MHVCMFVRLYATEAFALHSLICSGSCAVLLDHTMPDLLADRLKDE